jgi:hypothetical protein
LLGPFDTVSTSNSSCTVFFIVLSIIFAPLYAFFRFLLLYN